MARCPAYSVSGARPSRRHRRRPGSEPTAIFNLRTNRRSAYATILAGALSYFAAMQIMIAHGAWLADQYGLDPAQLGFVAFIFGWFDLAASVSVSLFTDRIGKRRSVLIGIAGSLVGYALMPVLNTSVTLAVVAIAFARMCFEFNIVSHFPLLSEQVPAQRGQAMTLGSAAALVAGTVAGFSGPWLLVTLGVPALAWTFRPRRRRGARRRPPPRPRAAGSAARLTRKKKTLPRSHKEHKAAQRKHRSPSLLHPLHAPSCPS